MAILIGAGCPASIEIPAGKPLIPAIAGLTAVVRDQVCAGSQKSHWDTLCSELAADGKTNPSVEEILSRVRGLREYAGSSTLRGLTGAELGALEELICRTIVDTVDVALPPEPTGFHWLATWIGAVDRSSPVELFTTNYDLLIEQALELHRIPYFDGFPGSREPFFDPYSVEADRLPPRWVRLWKLHGSINWGYKTIGDGDSVVRLPAPSDKAVIHPSHLKYDQSRKMPYLAILDRLRSSLSSPGSVLITVGYSFNDQHLNNVILQSLQGNSSAVAFGLLHGAIDGYPAARSIARVRSNLRLEASDGAVISTEQVVWATQDTDPDPNPNPLLCWKKEAASRWRPSLLIGDFLQFGEFLHSIVRGARA